MQFAVIDNNKDPMEPDRGRGLGFVQALTGWVPGKDYQFVRHDQVATRLADLAESRGLILSGSAFDFALPDGRFDRETYRTMAPEFRLVRGFHGPVLGICFGHQLLALAEEFEEHRTDFGRLKVHNMRHPQDNYLVAPVRVESDLRFTRLRELWGQFNHKQEVTGNDALQVYFEVVAGSPQCPVEIIQHRSRDWFGVQFHPETGKDTKAGETSRHQTAVEDGRALIRDFVRYCLRRGC